jgi:hypothetical protein
VHLLLFLRVEEGLLLIHTDTIILISEIIDKRTDGGWHVVQPLRVFFFYECLAHTIKLSHAVHSVSFDFTDPVAHRMIGIGGCILNLPGTLDVSSPVVKN